MVGNAQHITDLPTAMVTGIQFLKVNGAATGTGGTTKAAQSKPQLTV